MTPQEEKLIHDKLKEELESSYIRGLSTGTKTVSKVIYDKVNNVNRQCTKNDLLRVIKDIKSFCETGLAIKPEETK